MESHIPIRLMVNTPTGKVALTPQTASLQLPGGPDSTGPILAYGPYLTALSRFIAQDSFRPLLEALSRHQGKPADLDALEEVEVISQKHGALYHVAQVRARASGCFHSFALNVAVRPEQQAFLEAEYGLLNELHRRSGLAFLPQPYLLGEADYETDPHSRQIFKLFLAEWFDGYHEFHLSDRAEGATPAIRVWDYEEGQNFLTREQELSLYRQEAAILTGYFDLQTYEQIYPWHHAAGDFVLRRDGDDVEVRLITARDYRSLTDLGPSPEVRWIAVAHFFLNLTIRLRLDRLDGTGPLAWANANALRGIVEGFLRAWSHKAGQDPSLPSEADVLEVFGSFSPDEWLPLAEVILETCLVEADEHGFLQPRMEDHVRALSKALQSRDSEKRD